MATSADPSDRCLTGTPWSVRLGRASEGRTALEVYDAESLIDVVVATRVAPEILRGARRGHRSAFAWGRLPLEAGALTVLFGRGRRHRDVHAAGVIAVGGFCWLAVAHGTFNNVTVSHRGARRGRLRMRKVR
ncbi:hypothetical protein GCM10027176_81470 [Actinoallomurus bryophytorum]|uniref:Uncharacterized protein n=1 Tax=Actinoallomurus bryophytorum TaxID=1490222 RepID=A0A543CI25_9ACTN|nr:hypothetical protein [Actinoallomurus bryophytorum]TQL96763.1 hypothetical protein FB559_2315 [Actinoallomurus bryophytorum]